MMRYLRPYLSNGSWEQAEVVLHDVVIFHDQQVSNTPLDISHATLTQIWQAMQIRDFTTDFQYQFPQNVLKQTRSEGARVTSGGQRFLTFWAPEKAW